MAELKIDQDVFTKSVDTPIGELMIDPGDYIESNLPVEHKHDPKECKKCSKLEAIEDEDKREEARKKLGSPHDHDSQFCDECREVEDRIRELAGDWESAYEELQKVARQIRAATGVDGNDWTAPE